MSKSRWMVWFVMVSITAAPALASGFSIFEQSAKASGQAGAWVARADDAAANWYNPATLVRQHGMQFQIGTNLIPIGNDTDLTVTDAAYLLPYTGSTTPQTYSAEGNLATPSHIYFTQNVNDRIAWGIGVNNPFGLITQWDDLPVTLAARKSELVTWVVNPNVAFALGSQWSIAVGVDYMLADVKEFSRDIDSSETGLLPPGMVVAQSNLTGDGDAWGYNIALHRAGEKWSFGLTYRSELSPQVDGDLEFSNVLPLVSGVFQNTKGSAELDLPAEAAVGAAWHLTDAWNVELDVAFAGWSSFEKLVIDTENPAFDTVLVENWDDTFSYRIGASWDLAEKHQLRFGAVYDESPIPTQYLRPSIPDSDRTGVSAGYGYTASKWNLDAYVMPLWFADITANGTASGVIDGTYKSSTILSGVTFNLRF